MKGLKDFRRSLNKDRHSNGQSRPNAAAPALFMGVKNAVSIQPPKKVIRATRDYKSRAPQELSFSKGDFFHVLSDETNNPDWLEATNPLTNARGLVPATYFDILSKSGRSGPPLGGGVPGPAGTNVSSTFDNSAAPVTGTAAGSSVVAKTGGGFYAVVKFDFVAERADELEASAGEPIIVIAQSNFEWFVAKPIGRLGGPGLIPVTFVELKDVTNGQKVENVDELISKGIIPKVEEWKKMTADYKKNTIPLGRFEFENRSGGGGGGGSVGLGSSQSSQGSNMPPPSSSAAQQYYNSGAGSSSSVNLPMVPSKDLYPSSSSSSALESMSSALVPSELPLGMPPGEPLPTGLITSAQVDSFHFEQGDYWFRIQASHISSHVPSAPIQAPIAPIGEERDLILYRLYEDFYEFQIALLDHFPREAGRETQGGVQNTRILPLMPGPLDQVDDLITSQRRNDLDTYINELCALPEYIMTSELVRLFFEPRPGDHCTVQPIVSRPAPAPSSVSTTAAAAAGTAAPLLSGTQTGLNGYSNGTSKYSEEAPVGSQSEKDDSRKSVGELSSSLGNLQVAEGNNGQHSRSDSNLLRSQASISKSTSNATGVRDSRSSASMGARAQSPHTTGPSPSSGGAGSMSGVGGAGSAGAPAFIKIKIFNRATDDLVAIRVPPSVTFASLMDKVKERLGSEISILRYKDPESGANVMMRMSDDDDLREYLSTADKFQLFADTR
ncbi:hypothetical protein CBS101457_001370 [Exobasidium rhododendri]|nr:hypothetical protein CBS101457_001370 [Exobasidium rhododendri]